MTQSYSEISFDSQSPPISDIRSLIDSPEPDDGRILGERTDRPDRLDLKNDKHSDPDDDIDPPSYHKAMGYLQHEGTVMQVSLYYFVVFKIFFQK